MRHHHEQIATAAGIGTAIETIGYLALVAPLLWRPVWERISTAIGKPPKKGPLGQ